MLELYENIKRIRKEKGMTQTELAKLTGYTDRSSIAKIEKGEVDLSNSKIVAFANALRVPPGDLMGFDPEYTKNDLKTLEKTVAKDTQILEAYHSSSEEVQGVILKILGIETEG